MVLHGLRILKFVESMFSPSKDSSKKRDKQKQAPEKLKTYIPEHYSIENHNRHNIKTASRSATNFNKKEKNGKASVQSDPEKKKCLCEIFNNFGLRRRRRRYNFRKKRNKNRCSKHIAQSLQQFSKERTFFSDTRLSKDVNHTEGNRIIDVTAPEQLSSTFKNNSFNLYTCKVEYENLFSRKLSKALHRNKNGSNCCKCPNDKSSSKTKWVYDNTIDHFNKLNFPNENSIANARETVKPYSTRSKQKDTKSLDEISVFDKPASDDTLPVDQKMNKPTMACNQVKASPHNERKPKENKCEIISTHPKSQMEIIDKTVPVCDYSKFQYQTNKKRAKKPFFAYFATKVFNYSRYEVNKKERARRKKSVRRDCSLKTAKLPESHPSSQRNHLDRTSKRQLGSSLIPHSNTISTSSVDYSIWKPSKKCEGKNISCDLPAKPNIGKIPTDVIKKKCKYATTYRHRHRRSGNSKHFVKLPTEHQPINQYECYCAMFNKHPQNHNGDGNFCCPYEDCPRSGIRSNQAGDRLSKTSVAIDSVPDSKKAKKRGQGMCKYLGCRYIKNHGDHPRQPCTCISNMLKEQQSPPRARRQSKQGSTGKGDNPLIENYRDNTRETCTCISKMMKEHQSPRQARRQSKQGSTGKDDKSHKQTTKLSSKVVVVESRHENTKNKQLNASRTDTSVKGVQCCPPKPILHNHKCQCKADPICFCFGDGDGDNDEGVGSVRGGGGGGGVAKGGGGRRNTATSIKRDVAAGKKSVTAPGKKEVASLGKKGAKAANKKGAKAANKKGAKAANKKGAKPANKKEAKTAGKKKTTLARKKGAKRPSRKGAKATRKKKGKVKVKKRKEYFGKKGAKNRAKELKKYKKGFGKFVKGARKIHDSKRCKYLRVFERKVRTKICPRKTVRQKMARNCCNCLKFVGRLLLQRCIEYYEHRKASKKRKTFLKRLYHFICFPLRKTKYAIIAIFDLFNETNGYITRVDCDTLYIHALRDRPCFWVYKKWPKLYPYFLHYRKSFLHCMNILMIIMAAFMWIPVVMSCYLFISLLRACLCN